MAQNGLESASELGVFNQTSTSGLTLGMVSKSFLSSSPFLSGPIEQLDEEPEVNVLGLGLRPPHLPVMLVADVHTHLAF